MNQTSINRWICALMLGVFILLCLALTYEPNIVKYTRRIISGHSDPGKHRYSSSNNYVIAHLSQFKNGPKLRGKIIREQNVELAQFLGIRYASKPKRFHKTQPAKHSFGIKDALKWPPFCMQNRIDQFDYLTKIYNKNISEDCLFLNIWSPLDNVLASKSRSKDVSELLPVIIFIHGGSFSFMGISMEAFYGGVIAALGKVVFVTINYRLGVYGFFDSGLDDGSFDYSKNLGLYDQITAIQWVRKNIRHFGGDPNQITLQGQSAGAISIGLHMISPHSRNLFKRAILQSASPMMLKQLFTSTHFERVVQLSNCTAPSSLANDDSFISKKDKKRSIQNEKYKEDEGAYNDENEDDDDDDYDEDYDYETPNVEQTLYEIKCIEQLPAINLNRVQNQMLNEYTISFGPSIPSELIPDYAENEAQNIVQHEMLIGANLNESTLFLHQILPDLMPLTPELNVTLEDLLQMAYKLDNNSVTSRQFGSMILNSLRQRGITKEKDMVDHFMIFLSDFMFKGPVFKFAKLLSIDPDKKVYLYMFNETTSIYPKWIGAPHWNEMDYVFGMPLLHPEKFSKLQQQLSTRMIKSWTNFARTGKMLPQHGIKWPRLDERNLHMTLMANNVSLGHQLEMMFYQYFDLIYDAS